MDDYDREDFEEHVKLYAESKAYKEGYNAHQDAENPYEYYNELEEKLDNKAILTEEDYDVLNDIIDNEASDHEMWERGNEASYAHKEEQKPKEERFDIPVLNAPDFKTEQEKEKYEDYLLRREKNKLREAEHKANLDEEAEIQDAKLLSWISDNSNRRDF